MNNIQRKLTTKIGPLYLVASSISLKGIFWDKQPVQMEDGNKNPAKEILDKTEQQLEEYFEGRRKEFDLPLDAEGTDFQKHVWTRLSKIPYGATRSYKDIAIEINNEKACRAVGSANGKNPLSIVVPCHRVISSDGTLGGFAGGLDIKLKLLSLEKTLS